MTIEATRSTPALSAVPAYTGSELLGVMSARLLKDGQTVFAGVGIPLLAAILAQKTHAPGLTILFEGGVIGPFVEAGKLPPSTNEQRCTRRANMLVSITEVLLMLQRGYVDVGFMGGAQIDRFGNLNSSFIGDPANPKIRLPGTGGGNDIALAGRHDRRHETREAPLRGKGRLHHLARLPRWRPDPRGTWLAGGRHVPRRHRHGHPRL